MTDTAPRLAPRTVVEAFLPADGEVRLDQVYDAAAAAGLSDQSIRLAIRRLEAGGLAVQSGRGRNGSLRLTTAGRTALGHDRLAFRLVLAQDHGLAPWDGCWRLVSLQVPEADRAVRDLLRRTLLSLGAAPLGTSLYVSPHDLTTLLPAAHRSVLITATATDLDVGGRRDPIEIAEALWPAARTLAAYAGLGPVITRARHDTHDPAQTRQLRLADALERTLRDDPLLPPELRTAPWLPTDLRRSWYAAWRELDAQTDDNPLFRGWLDLDP